LEINERTITGLSSGELCGFIFRELPKAEIQEQLIYRKGENCELPSCFKSIVFLRYDSILNPKKPKT
jgi:hypothetical protein